jgi:hypothetical protein
MRIRELSGAEADPSRDRPGPSAKRFPVRWKGDTGTWHVVGDTLFQTSYDPHAELDFGELNWTDYDFSVDFIRLAGNDQVCLTFRINRDLGHEYFFGLATYKNTLNCLEVVADGQIAFVFQTPRVPSATEFARWYKARVSVRGGSGTCFLDEQRIGSFEGHPVRSGCVGLRTWESLYAFRNLRVTAPDGKVLLEGVPDVVDGVPRQ